MKITVAFQRITETEEEQLRSAFEAVEIMYQTDHTQSVTQINYLLLTI